MPRVSVIIPNYNHARYIRQRINSVWDQTWQDAEYIYLDDASTDNSAQVVEQLLAERPEYAARTRLELNTTNSGSPFKQWNKGARLATGEYLWIAEADDYADPRLLESLVAKLDENPKAGIAYCQSWAVDAEGETIANAIDFLDGGHMPPVDKTQWRHDFVSDGRNECSRHLICRNTIPNASAVLLRRSVFEAVGGADESFRLAGDWVLWIRMLLRSDLAFVAEPLNHFRLHQKSVTHQARLCGVEAEENYLVVWEILREARPEPKLAEKVYTALLDGWMRPALHGQASISAAQHRRIYSIAAKVDPRLRRRIMTRGRQSLRHRTRQIAGKVMPRSAKTNLPLDGRP